MTGDDLKRLQDNFLGTAKAILLDDRHLHMMGFVVTLRKHVDKLFESGYGLEFLDPKDCLREGSGDGDEVATLIVDLPTDYKKLYHAVMNVFPQTKDVLPRMIELGKSIGVEDAYTSAMNAFLRSTQLEEKDIVAAVMRQICDKVDAFASIMQSEAWMRIVDSSKESVDDVYKNAPGGLKNDAKSVEVIVSSMETHDFARMLAVPIQRKPSKKQRGGGKVLGFGKPHETVDTPDNTQVLQGRLMRFLKPLPAAS